MIKIEKELFLSEKKQLNEYVQTLKLLIEKANKENNLKIQIPGKSYSNFTLFSLIKLKII